MGSASRSPQQPAMAEDAAAQHIQLKVKDQQGSEVQFKIKKATPLRKLMDAYCSRLGLQASQVRFMVDGERIAPDDTAEKLGLEDEDLIDVAMEQTGGKGKFKCPGCAPEFDTQQELDVHKMMMGH